jgi:hypothetical protein
MAKLTCHGCCHETAEKCRIMNIHLPSGERPCCFCIRNPDRNFKVKVWYDGSLPVKIPMDCYLPLDMQNQIMQWDEERRQKTLDEVRKALGMS